MLREIDMYPNAGDGTQTLGSPPPTAHPPSVETSRTPQPRDLPGSIRNGPAWSEWVLAKAVVLQLK